MHPRGRPGRRSRLLALVCPASVLTHLGSEPAGGDFSLTLPGSVTLPSNKDKHIFRCFKNQFKKEQSKQVERGLNSTLWGRLPVLRQACRKVKGHVPFQQNAVLPCTEALLGEPGSYTPHLGGKSGTPAWNCSGNVALAGRGGLGTSGGGDRRCGVRSPVIKLTWPSLTALPAVSQPRVGPCKVLQAPRHGQPPGPVQGEGVPPVRRDPGTSSPLLREGGRD